MAGGHVRQVLSSHKGGIFVIPSVPQARTGIGPSPSRHCTIPSEKSSGDRAHVVGAEDDAAPVRVGRTRLQAASAKASKDAATPIWHSRHIIFSPLRTAFF